MEDWKSMAAAVKGNNPHWNPTATAAFQAIEVARSHFARAALVCASFRQELPYHPAPAGDARPYYLPTAMDSVRTAILRTRRLSVSHAGSGHVFSLCTARTGLQDAAPLTWQRWQAHHAQATAHAATALQRLHSAWSRGATASDAVFVMLKMAPLRISAVAPLIWGAEAEHAAHQLLDNDYERHLALPFQGRPIPPLGFPLWDAWGHAAEQLLRRAADDLAMARAALEQMRRAVVAQFFDACGILLCPVPP